MRERLNALAVHARAAFAPGSISTETHEFETQLQEWVNEGGAPLENRTEAARRINDARRKKRLALDLSSLGLTTLPDCIGKPPMLKTLKLNDNQLTRLPESVKNISVVNVTGNPLPDMPDLDNLPTRMGTGSNRTRSQQQQRLIINL